MEIDDYIFETPCEIADLVLHAYPEYVDLKLDHNENEVVLYNLEIKLDLNEFLVDEPAKEIGDEVYLPVQIGDETGYVNQNLLFEPPTVYAAYCNGKYFNVVFDSGEVAKQFLTNSFNEMVSEGLVIE